MTLSGDGSQWPSVAGLMTIAGGVAAWWRLRRKDVTDDFVSREEAVSASMKLVLEAQNTMIVQQGQKILTLEGRYDDLNKQFSASLVERVRLEAKLEIADIERAQLTIEVGQLREQIRNCDNLLK